MLRQGAPAVEIAALGTALRQLATDESECFDALFDPAGRKQRVGLASQGVAALLRSFGLVEDQGDDLFGRHRIRRCGDRLYVMEIGADGEYQQDVWPETDALLAVLDEAAPGRLLDLGTGCGIIAIEAAARGHRVIATDLYPSALDLARFNAALNGLDGAIDFRQGHWCEPVQGERFDLILTAPHYGRVNDQLRLEVLRSAPLHLAPGGNLVVATALEWAGDDGPVAVVEAILRPLVASGASVQVTPLRAAVKREWFTVARGEIPGLVSRHRFLVTITPGGGRLDVERPLPEEQPERFHVPLARLRLGAAELASAGIAVLSTCQDLAALRRLLGAIRDGLVTVGGVLPSGLLDACRLGARRCVSPVDTSGASGAILAPDGAVRPCTHGGEVARSDHSMAEVLSRLRALAVLAEARRGCEACPARAMCSRCLFPGPLDETDYCDLVREYASELPHLHRLFALLGRLAAAPRPSLSRAPVRIKLRPGTPLLVAAERPDLPPGSDHAGEALVRVLTARWQEREAWLVVRDDEHFLSTKHGDREALTPMESPVAALGELIAEGATAAALTAYRAQHRLPGNAQRRTLGRLVDLLAGCLTEKGVPPLT
ncbi:MAG: methyltransferase domain-containing protein [Myxococcales bacterium]|nr:methyltransferase domain-containing protein [Myxococcales bacterium]